MIEKANQLMKRKQPAEEKKPMAPPDQLVGFSFFLNKHLLQGIK